MSKFDQLKVYLIENEGMPGDAKERHRGSRDACKLSSFIFGFPRTYYIAFSDGEILYGAVGICRHNVFYDRLDSKKATMSDRANRRIIMDFLRSSYYS